MTADATGAGAAYGGALGGYDVAIMYDAVGQNTYYAGPGHSRIVYDGGKEATALGFFRMDSYQSADDGSTDVAYLYGSSGDDVLESYEDSSLMGSASYIHYILGYGEVIADVTGTAGTEYGADSGGVDVAALYDSAGADTFYAGPSRGRMEYQSGQANEAKGFVQLQGVVLFGGTDTAALYGSNGDDVYFSVEDGTTLYGPGYYIYAGGFDTVTGDMTGATGGSYGGVHRRLGHRLLSTTAPAATRSTPARRA